MKQQLQPVGYSDQPAWLDERWTQVTNFTFRRGLADRCKGDQLALTLTGTEPQHAVNTFEGGVNYWVIPSKDIVELWDGTTLSTITPASYPLIVKEGTVTGGTLNQYPVINCSEHAQPYYWPLTGDLLPMPLAPQAASYAVGFDNILIALNTEANIVPNIISTSEAVAWSSPTDGFPIDADWQPASNNLAGSVQLGTTTAPCQSFKMLRQGVGIVGKQSSLWAMVFTGGQSVFSFKQLFGAQGGCISANAMSLSFEGSIYGMSAECCWVTNGSQIKDLSANRVTKTFLAELALAGEGSWVAVVETAREVWFCPVTTGQYPTSGWVYSIESGEFGRRTLTSSYGVNGINAASIVDTWALGGLAPDLWNDGNNWPWNFRAASPQTSNFLTLSPLTDEAYWTDLNEDTRQSLLVKEGIRPDPAGTGVVLVTRVWLDCSLVDPATVTISSRYNDADPYSNQVSGTFSAGSQYVSLACKGRDFRLQIEASGRPYTVTGAALEYSEAGSQF